MAAAVVAVAADLNHPNPLPLRPLIAVTLEGTVGTMSPEETANGCRS